MATRKSSGFGLEKISPGKWRARITWRDSAGKRRDTERVVDADTKAQAVAERERTREELAGTGDEWTVEEAIKEWLPTMRSGTRRSREIHARRFAERFGKLRMSAVKTADAQRWISEIKADDSTANYHRASILALYKFARARGRLRGDDPAAKTVNRRTPKTDGQLLEELESEEPQRAIVGDDLPRFFAALLETDPDLYPLTRFQLLIGCRWSEAAAVQWRDIDWDTGVVTIRRSQSRGGELGPPKGKRRRTAALGPAGLAFMRGHRADMESKSWPGSDAWAFPRPPTGRARPYDMWPYPTAYVRVKRVLTALGLDMPCATHAMRHTHITLARALESDHAMQMTVGHSNEKMTERYTDESRRKAVAQSYAGAFEERAAGGVFSGADVVDLAESKRNRRKT